MDENQKPGPTGDYPMGKLAPDDEGGLKMRFKTVGERLIIDFGTQVAWIGLGERDARAMGEMLIREADKLAQERLDGRIGNAN